MSSTKSAIQCQNELKKQNENGGAQENETTATNWSLSLSLLFGSPTLIGRSITINGVRGIGANCSSEGGIIGLAN